MDKQIDMFDTINTRNETPDKEMPESVNLTKKQRWCPYCSKPVVFIRDKVSGVKRCPYCNISEKDYNVKMVNNNWL